jgi:hypothetical protein
VGLDQRVGDLVQEMPSCVGDAEVVTRKPSGSLAAVVRSFLLTGQRFGQPPLPSHAGAKRLGRIGDAGDLDTVCSCGDHERRQAPVDADPAAMIGLVAWLVLVGRMLPLRLPERESDHAAKALLQSTAASSNTCWHTWPRHDKPVTTISPTPSAPTATTRPACSVFFHALKVLMRSNPLQGTATLGSVLRSVRAVLTVCRHWSNANREAPAWRASTSRCSSVGSRQNRKVVCLLMLRAVSHRPPTTPSTLPPNPA